MDTYSTGFHSEHALYIIQSLGLTKIFRSKLSIRVLLKVCPTPSSLNAVFVPSSL